MIEQENEDIIEVKRLLAEEHSQRKVAEMFNIDQSTVSRINSDRYRNSVQAST